MMRLAVLLSAALLWLAPALPPSQQPAPGLGGPIDTRRERDRVIAQANKFLKDAPVTVTASRSPRSAGGLHDYFSEGDYWWPDPANPDGPYIQKDGMSNPGNFNDHRRALMRLSVEMPALTTAYILTKDRKYAIAAERHARAWFVSRATRMNPALRYAQAIHGRVTGRGTGIIDDPPRQSRAHTERLDDAPGWQKTTRTPCLWFRFLVRSTGIGRTGATRPSHATCWVMNRGLRVFTRNRPDAAPPHRTGCCADGARRQLPA
jgi:hypothetical protein